MVDSQKFLLRVSIKAGRYCKPQAILRVPKGRYCKSRPFIKGRDDTAYLFIGLDIQFNIIIMDVIIYMMEVFDA